MKRLRFFNQHSLFYLLLIFFVTIAIVDITNLDSVLYKVVCTIASPIHRQACADYYDIPIWSAYLLLAVLVLLYHVHAEIRLTNTHLRSGKK